MRTVVLTSAAARDLEHLPPSARSAIGKAIARYAIHGEGDVKALVGRAGYRLRVGEYRVLFDQDATTILAFYVGRRTTTTYRGG